MPLEYAGPSSGLKSRGPSTLPAEAPMETMADVVLRFVSPAVLWDDHE